MTAEKILSILCIPVKKTVDCDVWSAAFLHKAFQKAQKWLKSLPILAWFKESGPYLAAEVILQEKPLFPVISGDLRRIPFWV